MTTDQGSSIANLLWDLVRSIPYVHDLCNPIARPLGGATVAQVLLQLADLLPAGLSTQLTQRRGSLGSLLNSTSRVTCHPHRNAASLRIMAKS